MAAIAGAVKFILLVVTTELEYELRKAYIVKSATSFDRRKAC
jgi:hypothetical protein